MQNLVRSENFKEKSQNTVEYGIYKAPYRTDRVKKVVLIS